jgi:hypothetical protein
VAPYEGDGLGAAALELGDALAAAEGLAATVGLADGSALGVGEAVTRVVPVGTDFWLMLRPMGTATIPRAVTIRKLTAPHSRRRNSLSNRYLIPRSDGFFSRRPWPGRSAPLRPCASC